MSNDVLVQSIINAGDRLAEATEVEMALEDRRPIVKADAIKRLMAAAGLSATAAEKLVEQDDKYADLLRQKRAATVERITARAYYDATVARAKLAAGQGVAA